MDALKAIKTRRSIREYRDKAITKELLKSIVDAGRFAPTARGVQPWEFVVVRERATLKRIGEIAENGRFVSEAPACIAVLCSDTKYYLEDGCAATENILIAATSYGIATCWIAGDKKPYCQELANLLNVPASFKLVSLIALGYPQSKGSFRAIDKRSLEEVTHWDKF